MKDKSFLEELEKKLNDLDPELRPNDNLNKNRLLMQEMLQKFDKAMDELRDHKEELTELPRNRLMDY